MDTDGESMMEMFDASEQPDRAFVRLQQTKRRQGYHDADAIGTD